MIPPPAGTAATVLVLVLTTGSAKIMNLARDALVQLHDAVVGQVLIGLSVEERADLLPRPVPALRGRHEAGWYAVGWTSASEAVADHLEGESYGCAGHSRLRGRQASITVRT